MLATWFLVPAILIGPAADVPPPSPAELDALYARMKGADAADRLAAASALAAAPPTGFDLYAGRLKRARTIPVDTFRTLILETWAQVPNPNYAKDGQLWTHKPEPPWKPPPPSSLKKGEKRPRRPPPHDPEKIEWLGALAALDLDGNPALAALPDRVEARAEAMEAVGLMRALAASGRSEALDVVFDFAFALDGAFRDECGRAIRSMDGRAVPALIRRQHAPGKGIALFRQRRYASYQLDRMDRASPFRAIATAPDDRTRAEILHAYGETRALEAVEPVLGQVDAAAGRVREQARWAWLRYVTGPPPPAMPKRFRKLPGGHAESEEKEDYLNYREMAVLAIGRLLAEIHDEEFDEKNPPPVSEAKALTDQLFAYYDDRRTAAWKGAFEGGLAKAKANDVRGAVEDFNGILAHDPFFDRRGEMADAFLRYGESLLARDPEAATNLLRQALLLDPGSERARRAEAQLSYLDGMKRLSSGEEDRTDFERALALDPSLSAARAVLDAEDARRRKQQRTQMVVYGAIGAMLAAAVFLAMLLALRKPQPPEPPILV